MHGFCARIVMIGAVAAALAGPAVAQTAPPAGFTDQQTRELVDAARAMAKSSREAVDYLRVMPDQLDQVQTKLDKLEDKLGKLEDKLGRIDETLRAGQRRR